MRNQLRARPISYLLLAPSVVVLLSLLLYPLGFALINSFYFWNLQTSPVPVTFIGLDNYRMIFQVTPFVEALKNTLLLSVFGVFFQFLFGSAIALLLNSQLRGMTVCARCSSCPPPSPRSWSAFCFATCTLRKGACSLGAELHRADRAGPGILGSANTASLRSGRRHLAVDAVFRDRPLCGLLASRRRRHRGGALDGRRPGPCCGGSTAVDLPAVIVLILNASCSSSTPSTWC